MDYGHCEGLVEWYDKKCLNNWLEKEKWKKKTKNKGDGYVLWFLCQKKFFGLKFSTQKGRKENKIDWNFLKNL